MTVPGLPTSPSPRACSTTVPSTATRHAQQWWRALRSRPRASFTSAWTSSMVAAAEERAQNLERSTVTLAGLAIRVVRLRRDPTAVGRQRAWCR